MPSININFKVVCETCGEDISAFSDCDHDIIPPTITVEPCYKCIKLMNKEIDRLEEEVDRLENKIERLENE
jgi:hypothetical protein